MKRMTMMVGFVIGSWIGARDGATAATAALSTVEAAACDADAVLAATVCLDRYEASVWRVPDPATTNAPLVKKIQVGSATLADLEGGGATQLGTAKDDYAPCADDGRACADDVYAVSLPAAIPSTHVTWFQAQQACANAGKRLPTSAEWQVGAYGTPDPGPDDGRTDCNSATNIATPTGARSGCVSSRGAFDMVGNVEEWVADWVPLAAACGDWGGLSDDRMCVSGASAAVGGPGALTRGGSFVDGPGAGPLAIVGGRRAPFSIGFIGFRCTRSAPGPLPGEVDDGVRLSRSGSDAVLSWNVADGATTSAVLRGHVGRLPVGSAGADEQCLIEGTELHSFTDTEIPTRGDSFWYLVRGASTSGNGPYGFEGLHGEPAAPRRSDTCP